MFFKIVIAAALIAAVSTEPKPCICTLEFQPVCGSNGVTYGNKCQFSCAQRDNPALSIRTSGECDSDSDNSIQVEKEEETCICTFDMRPLCGSDGVVYNNPCLFDCAQKKNPVLTVLHTGTCDSTPELPSIAIDPPVLRQTQLCICTREFNPVCASNGKTYGNQCEFECAKRDLKDLEITSQGSC